MYITHLELHHIKCFKRLIWSIAGTKTSRVGWHVILGDNATGKTTILKSITACTYNPNIENISDTNFFQRSSRIGIIVGEKDTQHIEKHQRPYEFTKHAIKPCPPFINLFAFGSFRRSEGGDSRYDAILRDAASPAAACLTLFVESAALREAPKWLCHLRAKSFENRALRPDAPDREGALLEQIIAFINAPAGDVALLANGARIEEVSVDEVYFVDSHGARVRIWDLSEGYQSVLCIVLETLRLMAARAAPDAAIIAQRADGRHVVDVEGIILIDEVDAHLHPDWQTRIGRWFVQNFPKVQFIVTTHSPLICQAVALGGSVFKLPAPGSDEQARFLEGIELNRLVYGNILDAYGTGAFGEVERAPEAAEKLERLALLNDKEFDEGLTPEEENEQEELRKIFGTAQGISKK